MSYRCNSGCARNPNLQEERGRRRCSRLARSHLVCLSVNYCDIVVYVLVVFVPIDNQKWTILPSRGKVAYFRHTTSLYQMQHMFLNIQSVLLDCSILPDSDGGRLAGLSDTPGRVPEQALPIVQIRWRDAQSSHNSHGAGTSAAHIGALRSPSCEICSKSELSMVSLQPLSLHGQHMQTFPLLLVFRLSLE